MSGLPEWLQFLVIFLWGYVPLMLIFRTIDRKARKETKR